MIKSLILALAMVPLCLNATLRVAVLDTGINRPERFKMCPGSPINLTTDKDASDWHGHGTSVVDLITKMAGKSDYCIDVFKIFPKDTVRMPRVAPVSRALYLARLRGAHVINLALTGDEPDLMEQVEIMSTLNRETTLPIKDRLVTARRLSSILVVASGNEGRNLSNRCGNFPVCYDLPGMIAVGNTSKTSNFGGPVKNVVNGNNHSTDGQLFSGSSQSTAIVTGMVVALVAQSALSNGYADSSEELAIQKALEATYVQSGASKIADMYVEELKRKSPKELNKVISILYPGLSALREGRLNMKFEF